MAARNKPYEQFGPYILFKKLEQDSLGDLWRAGRIDGGQLGPTLALRRFSGGNRAAMTSALEAVSQLLPKLAGTSFARDQVTGVAEDMPFVAWDYAGGRSLRHIIDRARGGKETQPNPLPIDQAIVIAEKVALSLATMADMRDTGGNRLSHGALLPQFIWISDDGEIRVAGQQLASGIIESLTDPKVAADVGRYFAPEIRTPGQKPKSADVYSMGAILFLLVTGQEPPDAMTASAFVAAVRAAKTMMGAPVPDDIRVILDKSFNLDPSMRYATVADMKQAVSALAHGGKYSATTFNLAFYLSNLLKKEMEAEAAERDKESKLNVAPYLEAPKPAAVAAPPAPTPVPAMFAAAEAAAAKPKSKLPLAIAAAVILAAVGIGGWMMIGRTSAKPASAVTTASMVPQTVPPKPRVISEPIVVGGGAATATAPVTATTGSVDPQAQKRAFEDAVKAKMQAEMMKLQNDYMEQLKKEQSRHAPVAAPAESAPAPAEERASLTAAQLTQQMRDARQEETPAAPAPAPVQTQQATATSAPAPVVPAPVPAPVQAPTIREGDVVDVGNLDVMPRAVRAITAIYPPIAKQQRISATVVVSALIDENGEVQQVKVLRGVGRFGIDEAAQRALKSARFTSPMKSGKRVKTWYPQTIEFRP